jgi:hypothetical protein
MVSIITKNPQHLQEKTFISHAYLIKDLYVEYRKNSYNLETRRQQPNLKRNPKEIHEWLICI